MSLLTAVVYLTVRLILRAYYYLLFARAIISFLPIEENGITDFIYGVTEVIISPVRCLTEKITGNGGFPFDISFTVVFVLITILLNIL